LCWLVNAALRALDRAAVKPWAAFIWLLMHALRKLPCSDVKVVLRGCKTTPTALGLDLNAGAEFQWSAFSSTATRAEVMDGFLGQSGDRVLWQLTLSERAGRDISAFSLYPKEAEVLEATSLGADECSHVGASLLRPDGWKTRHQL
jgi:hypothetical protein